MKGIINIWYDSESVTFWAESKGSTFGEYPHQDIYDLLFDFFKSIGFVQYKDKEFNKRYKCLSKTHHQFKSAKSPLLIYCEIYGRGFKIEVGHSKNSHGDGSLAFYCSGNQYRKINSYLENIRVRVMLDKIANHFINFEVEIKREKKLSEIEKIIKSDNENTHIHGPVECLEDIRTYIENKPQESYNCQDKDKNNLYCGQVKYFYDYNGILKRGKIWHHINNMWWVLCAKKRFNKACFELFDYYPGVPLKKSRLPKNRIKKLEQILKEHEEKRDYHKCIIINDLIHINDTDDSANN